MKGLWPINPLHIFLGLCLLFASQVLLAQNDLGLPDFSSVEGHRYDSINLQNLNVVVHISVRSKPGPIDVLPSFRTKLSMISAKERGSGYVEEQAHRGADHRGAEATGSGT